ncbi:MAG: putative DNA modification/repair radical SAM protein [Planctomycetota bacterium]
MDTTVKLTILADAAKYDASCSSSGSKRTNSKTGLGNVNGTGICHSYTPDGRCISLLKILFTNHCVYDCQYCINRVSSDTPRAQFTINEVVDLTVNLYKRNYIEGLFLSSGVIRNGDYTMDLLTEVARRLREDHQFNGYIHLKAVVGATPEAVADAGRYADRLSANIELPTQPDLNRLAPEKSHRQTQQTMSAIKSRLDESRPTRRPNQSINNRQSSIAKRPRFAPAGQSTQMIVGATPTPDADILHTATTLYSTHRLKRVYYTAYSPIPFAASGLPHERPPLLREHRLYQADWLLRFYGFTLPELTSAALPDKNLDLEIDPKLAWALAHRDFFPLDLNHAPREALLRVPGLGVRTVNRILSARRHRTLTIADLKRLGCALNRAKPFLKTTGTPNPDAHLLDRLDLRQRLAPKTEPKKSRIDPQLDLFANRQRVVAAATSALTGEV